MIPGQVAGNVNTGWRASDGSGGTGWTGILQRGASIFGTAAKYYGAYLGAQNQYESALATSTLMDAEAGLMDYNAYLARLEKMIAERERDIEVDQYRDEVRRVLGKQQAYYGWGNIAVGDPTGTPAAVRVRSMYNAEYNQGIIIERGWIKQQQAEGKRKAYEFKAAQIRASAKGVAAGGSAARTAGFIRMGTELMKDVGVT